MRYLLDTNQVSYIVRGNSNAARSTMLQRQQPQNRLFISAITEGELLYGLAKKPGAERVRFAVSAFILQVEVLPWDRQVAEIYGELRAGQEAAGRRHEPLDMLIAAHAIASDSILVSSDKAFRHVAGLPGLENWATDLQ